MRLADLRGFILDLDGCVWAGDELVPGAKGFIHQLRELGKQVAFLTNNSRERSRTVQERLVGLGVEAKVAEVITPVELLGPFILERFGPSRVLSIGVKEVAEAIAESGHELLPLDRYREATVVVVGNDPEFDFTRLTAASRAVAAGAGLVAPNLDSRLPIEGGDFVPGCGAMVEAVAVAGKARPLVVGKPEPPIFRMALARMGVEPRQAAMVGDSLEADIRGGQRVGMRTIYFHPAGLGHVGEIHPDLIVHSFDEMVRLLQ